MFENELQELRRHKWRVDSPSRAVFTVDDAREYLHSVGFCVLYPLLPPVVAPVFLGAFAGTDQKLPIAKKAFLDPRAKEAEQIKVRLLREQSAFEAAFGEDGTLLIAAGEFAYFYALIGERNPKQPPSPGARGEKALLTYAFEMIQAAGPITERDLRKRLGESVSDVALARTLHQLWAQLRIVRIDEGDTAETWEVLYRWAPEVIHQGKQISAAEALSALVSKYLETCVAAEQKDVEDFFGHLVPRSRIADVVRALQGAREISFLQVHGKTLLRNSPRVSAEEKAAQATAMAAVQAAHKAFPKRPWQNRAAGAKSEAWKKYGPPRDAGTRPPRSEGFAPRTTDPTKKKFSDKPGTKSDSPREGKPWQKSGPPREGKPWQKSSAEGGDRPWKKTGPPRGDKPWAKSGPRREGTSSATRGPGEGRTWQAKGPGFKSDHPAFKRGSGKDSAADPRSGKPFMSKTFGQKAIDKKPWKKKAAEGESSSGSDRAPGAERRPWKDRPQAKTGRPAFKTDRPAFKTDRPSFKKKDSASSSAPGGFSRFKGIGKPAGKSAGGGFKSKSGFKSKPGAKSSFRKAGSKTGPRSGPRYGPRAGSRSGAKPS